MKLVLATNHLGLGGSESYLLTIAEQLDRLGHEPVLYARALGGGADVARERGLAVVDKTENLPADCDAALVQDGGVSFEIASEFPGAPQVFVCHSAAFDLQSPPQLDDAVQVVVALNDRVAGWLRAFALDVELLRLRQPIDVRRFTPTGPLPDTPRRALLLSNTPMADRFGMLQSACAEAGLELARLGGREGQTTDPRPALANADIVIGYGRSILEAMACGRAAYVYDWRGGDGWVTANSYPELEADGFAGSGEGMTVDAERLNDDLRRYTASMGPVNHDLVVAHHRANVHAQEIVELFRRLGPGRSPRGPLAEMARLVRLEWRARSDSHALTHEVMHLRELLSESEAQRAESDRRAGEADHRRHRELGEMTQAYEQTLSWRLTRPLRLVGRVLRRSLGRQEPDGDAGTDTDTPAEWQALIAAAEQLNADVIPRNWMSPVPTEPERDLWSEPRPMAGVDLDVEGTLVRAESDLAGLAEGLEASIAAVGLEDRFALWNDSYQAADAELLYAMTRLHRPRQVVELGSGYTTMILHAALRENASQGGLEAVLASFDPGPVGVMGDGLMSGVEFAHLSVADIPIERFVALEAGDILFVDTTHTVKLGSEVNHLILDVLPRLRPGVIVHFHDIFLPYEYPRKWFERGMYFAEQYLLEAFLTDNDNFEVIFPAHAVAREARERLGQVLPSLADPRAADWVGPCAFWIRKRS